MSMQVGTIDRRMLFVLVGGVIAILLLRTALSGDKAPQVVSATESIPMAEKRLDKLRAMAATVPGKESVFKQAKAELDLRENKILRADTAAQAQAQVIETIQRIAKANGFDARGAEDLREAKALGKDYGEVTVTETFVCGIDQLVNFLSALANEPQILATNEIHITGGSDKKKNLQVRLSVSAAVPRKLVPVKKAGVF